jgi:hypothetical protein
MKRFISLLALLVFLIGCGQAPSVSPAYIPMKTQQVSDFLFRTNNLSTINDVIVDETYAVPTLKWVKEVYTPSLTQWLFDNGLLNDVMKQKGYIPEVNDCDDYADFAVTVARLRHRKNPDRPSWTSIPIGVVYS